MKILRALPLFMIAISVLLAPKMADAASPYTLQQAMGVDDRITLFSNKGDEGLTLSSGFFSSTANNSVAAKNYAFDNSNVFNNDQRIYALLIDGRYDFNYDFGSALPIHPYINGGLGMAVFGQNPGNDTNNLQNGSAVPLFRMGGGVTYRLGQEWDLSLDYRAGFSGAASSDQIFTNRGGQQAVDLHTLNMGMHYKF